MRGESFRENGSLVRELVLLPKPGFCSPVPNRDAETEFGEVEKSIFIALLGKGGHSRLTPSRLCPPSWEIGRGLIVSGWKIGL